MVNTYPGAMPFCPECEAFNNSQARDCADCGASMSGPPKAPKPPKRPGQPRPSPQVREAEESPGSGSAIWLMLVGAGMFFGGVYGVVQAPMQTIAACAVVCTILYFWRGK
jgi:hypothetical protein